MTNLKTLGIDEVEIDFLINVGNVSGVINFDAQGDGSDQTLIPRTSSYYLLDNDSVSFTFGNYGSALGLSSVKILQVFTQSLELIQTVTEVLETLAPVQLIKEAF